ncbi:MAG TPA: hypothetical protein VJV04_01470, partial [Nitrospiraceae bacterium]|nr:hypothetical protein [Nitrospiraceae bacterium]
MSSPHRARPKPAPPYPDISAAEVLAWVSECIEGGLCFVSEGILIFENAEFSELVEAADPVGIDADRSSLDTPDNALRKKLFTEAQAWNHKGLGTRGSREYGLAGRQGGPLIYECRFNVVPYQGTTGVLLVLQDVTERTLLAHEASQVARFQSVLARIGTLAVSDAPAQELMNEAVRLTAEALDVELCKILIPRDSDDHLAVMA